MDSFFLFSLVHWLPYAVCDESLVPKWESTTAHCAPVLIGPDWWVGNATRFQESVFLDRY